MSLSPASSLTMKRVVAVPDRAAPAIPPDLICLLAFQHLAMSPLPEIAFADEDGQVDYLVSKLRRWRDAHPGVPLGIRRIGQFVLIRTTHDSAPLTHCPTCHQVLPQNPWWPDPGDPDEDAS